MNKFKFEEIVPSYCSYRHIDMQDRGAYYCEPRVYVNPMDIASLSRHPPWTLDSTSSSHLAHLLVQESELSHSTWDSGYHGLSKRFYSFLGNVATRVILYRALKDGLSVSVPLSQNDVNDLRFFVDIITGAELCFNACVRNEKDLGEMADLLRTVLRLRTLKAKVEKARLDEFESKCLKNLCEEYGQHIGKFYSILKEQLSKFSDSEAIQMHYLDSVMLESAATRISLPSGLDFDSWKSVEQLIKQDNHVTNFRSRFAKCLEILCDLPKSERLGKIVSPTCLWDILSEGMGETKTDTVSYLANFSQTWKAIKGLFHVSNEDGTRGSQQFLDSLWFISCGLLEDYAQTSSLSRDIKNSLEDYQFQHLVVSPLLMCGIVRGKKKIGILRVYAEPKSAWWLMPKQVIGYSLHAPEGAAFDNFATWLHRRFLLSGEVQSATLPCVFQDITNYGNHSKPKPNCPICRKYSKIKLKW